MSALLVLATLAGPDQKIRVLQGGCGLNTECKRRYTAAEVNASAKLVQSFTAEQLQSEARALEQAHQSARARCSEQLQRDSKHTLATASGGWCLQIPVGGLVKCRVGSPTTSPRSTGPPTES